MLLRTFVLGATHSLNVHKPFPFGCDALLVDKTARLEALHRCALGGSLAMLLREEHRFDE